MNYIQRSMTFCAAHRLMDDPSQCSNLHGHNFTVTARLTGKIQTDTEMIVPISEIAKALKTIHDMYDHNILLYKHDPLVDILRDAGQAVFCFDGHPTTEHIAKVIKATLDEFFPRLHVAIHVQETDKNAAGAE